MEIGCCGRRSMEAVPALVADAVISSSSPRQVAKGGSKNGDDAVSSSPVR
jgi:hypothetical protein